MCNVVTDLYFLYKDGKEVLKGNPTRIPEALMDLNGALTYAGSKDSKFGKNIKNCYDYFVKDGHSKFSKLATIDQKPISFVMGLTDCARQKSNDKFKTFTSYIAGFGARFVAEEFMDSKTGSKLLKNISEKTSSVATKFLGLNGKISSKTCSFILSGLIYALVSDKLETKVENLTAKLIDKHRQKNNKNNPKTKET